MLCHDFVHLGSVFFVFVFWHGARSTAYDFGEGVWLQHDKEHEIVVWLCFLALIAAFTLELETGPSVLHCGLRAAG